MNTDPMSPLDLAGAIDAVGSASSAVALSLALEQVALAAGMNHFLLLHLHGAEQEVVAALHNLPSAPDIAGQACASIVQRALASRRIPELVEQVVFAGMSHAACSMWQEEASTCVLLIGQDGPIEASAATELLGVASLASSYAVGALMQVLKAECPFTARELECLVLAAAGCSAKEASQHLQVSSRTVEEYLARCKERMGVRSTLAATATALRRGWISYREIDAATETINRRYGASRR
jgi:DNA-binding NarL/FixJ family response regulator